MGTMRLPSFLRRRRRPPYQAPVKHWDGILGVQVGREPNAPFPHCDERVLHAPGTCTYCDDRPDLQAARTRDGISFSGQSPVERLTPGARWRDADDGEAVIVYATDFYVHVQYEGGKEGPIERHTFLMNWNPVPCPADAAVSVRARGDYNRWPGNRPAAP